MGISVRRVGVSAGGWVESVAVAVMESEAERYGCVLPGLVISAGSLPASSKYSSRPDAWFAAMIGGRELWVNSSQAGSVTPDIAGGTRRAILGIYEQRAMDACMIAEYEPGSDGEREAEFLYAVAVMAKDRGVDGVDSTSYAGSRDARLRLTILHEMGHWHNMTARGLDDMDASRPPNSRLARLLADDDGNDWPERCPCTLSAMTEATEWLAEAWSLYRSPGMGRWLDRCGLGMGAVMEGYLGLS